VTWRACGRPDGRRTERRVPPGCLVSRHPGEQAGTRFRPSEARSIVARLRRPLLRILDAVAPPYIPWPSGPARVWRRADAAWRPGPTRPGAPGRRGVPFRPCCSRHRASAECKPVTSALPATNFRSAYVDQDTRSAAGRCRTQWNRGFTALERAGSGGSWRSNWRGAPRPWGWRCRCDLSPFSRKRAARPWPLAVTMARPGLAGRPVWRGVRPGWEAC